jgi:serine protease Do
MALTANGATEGYAHLAEELAAVAERLRRATVQVRGRGRGGGSGVIWRPDGVIITNAHVTPGRRATVVLADGRAIDAVVTARDPWRDLAVLTAPVVGLPAASIGDSKALRVGALVFAVGTPLGVIGALTIGIIHAIAPAHTLSSRGWIYADVRLAPGNSGGPLADARGRVIGINSMIIGGLALAVPSHVVERFLADGGKRPFLGVTTQGVRVPLEGKRVFGLLVLEVVSGSPAEQAGLLLGDVLIGAGDHMFKAPDDLASALGRVSAGDTLQLNLIRGGVPVSRDVVVRTATDTVEAA